MDSPLLKKQPDVPQVEPADSADLLTQQPNQMDQSAKALAPTDVKTFTKKKKKKKKKGGQIYFSGISNLVILVSIRNLYLMLKSGLALNEAVLTLADQTPDERLSKIYTEISEKIESGQNLADSMREYPKAFSDVIVSVISVGEQGGTLEKNLLFLADYLKKAHTLGKKVKGALIYPGIVFGMTMVEMLGVIFLILPKLEDLFSAFEGTPALTKNILAFSAFVRNNAIILAAGFAVIIFLFMMFLRTGAGKKFKDILAFRTPIIKKLTKNNVLASFSRTLSILLETGIPLVSALDIATSTVSNSLYKKVLERIVKDVQSGRSVAESMGEYENYFPISFVKLIEVGERTGNLEENLGYLYEYHAEEVEELSENLSTLLEPLLLIFIGGMIGLLAIIIVGPIYQLTGSINSVQ